MKRDNCASAVKQFNQGKHFDSKTLNFWISLPKSSINPGDSNEISQKSLHMMALQSKLVHRTNAKPRGPALPPVAAGGIFRGGKNAEMVALEQARVFLLGNILR